MTSKPRRKSYKRLIASLERWVHETENTVSAITNVYEFVWAIEDEKALREIQVLAGRLRDAGSIIMDYSTRIDFLLTPIESDEAGRNAR